MVFERLGGAQSGALGRLTHALASSDAATLFLGLGAKAASSASRASLAMAELFEAVRELSRNGKADGYADANIWIGPELREHRGWEYFEPTARTAIDALDEAGKNLSSLAESVGAENPEMVIEVAD